MTRLHLVLIGLLMVGCQSPMMAPSVGDAMGKQMDVLASGSPQNHGLNFYYFLYFLTDFDDF